MQHVFWLIPGKLAGRPGPNQEPWDADELKRGGIGAVLSVNAGILVNPEDFYSRGMGYARIPFSDKAPPMPGDLEICLDALPKAYEFVSGRSTPARLSWCIVVPERIEQACFLPTT
jgi:hypothetical protein